MTAEYQSKSGDLHLFIGNRLETLAAALAEVTRDSLASAADPLQPEIILVQSKGMQRWISLSLARQNGICANMAFPFPNAFLERTYAEVVGQLPAHNPFDSQSLTFRIMTLLHEMSAEQSFGPIRNYFSGQDSELKCYQLSRKIADVFDQYLVFRPETIHAWENGQGTKLPEEQRWQAFLWQRIRADIKSPHRAELQNELIRQLIDDRLKIANLPARISVFGISYLPFFHLQVLDALAHRIPVYLFLLNPCRQFWADIRSDQQLARIRTRGLLQEVDPADLHFERGNRLLSSWGQQGRQFYGLIHHLEGHITELFQDYSHQTLLGHVQQDILDLEDPSAGPQSEFDKDAIIDDSIRVHVCHSPMRELEVLHDQLLDIFEGDSEINPGDILVMTPDIGQYTPYIHAVFGTSRERKESAIPYTVADQNIAGESRLVEGYLRLLQLKESRFEISRVMELLEYDALRRRFELEEGDLHQLETWLRAANVHWGWDGEHRRQQGLPHFETHTWRAGLDRLIAGYAMDMETCELFAGILPHEGIEGSDVHTLGKLILYAETLYQRIRQIPRRMTLEQWVPLLTELLDTFFHADDDTARDIQVLRGAVTKLDEIAADIQSRDEIGFEVVRQFLTDYLKQASFGAGFMAGSVTFCAMLPMRSIPAKVICLLGLQHDAFPQELRDPGFSIIAGDPRPGDRSKRNDDKYLFLEALLSARNIFYISYIGRDIQDNASKPPSVLVSELLEYIEQGYGITARRVITEHPLQPFSPAYFDGHNPRLFTYSKENREALRQMTAQSGYRPFFAEPLPPPDDSWQHCNIGQLNAFFAHPVRFLMEQRLGIYLKEPLNVLEDREQFNLDPLGGYHISQSLLESIRQGCDTGDHYRAVVAGGDLPPGTTGRVAHDRIDDEVKGFLNTLQGIWPDDEPKQVDLDLDLSPFHISGRIEGVFARVRIAYRLARLRPKDLMSAFITHLAMCMMPLEPRPETSLLVCKDAAWQFGPLEPFSAREIFSNYLSIYWEGLRMPASFFSLTSFEYAFKRVVKKKDRSGALKDAANKWRGGFNQTGESQDAYIDMCFRDLNPLTADFEAMALKVYKPLFAAARELPTPP